MFPGGSFGNCPLEVGKLYDGVTVSARGAYRTQSGTFQPSCVVLEMNGHEALQLARRLIDAAERHAQATTRESAALRRALGRRVDAAGKKG